LKPRLPLEPLRGFRDLLPPDSKLLAALADIFRELVELQGYRYVIPPTLERFQLFALKSGEEIRRTMYVFRDKAGREVAMRPEATASIARIYLKHLRGEPKPIRLYYIVNCFRYEEPQFARYREFWQAGVELLGLPGLEADIEVAKILLDYYEKLSMLPHIEVVVNNIAIYRKLFNKYNVAEEEQDRILHYMDKKEYEKATELLERHGDELREIVKCLWDTGSPEEALDKCNVEPYSDEVKNLLVFVKLLQAYKPAAKIKPELSFARGLAYYDGIIFEVKVPGFPVSIAGGGRYSGLIALYGGEDVPGTGFAIGLDRTAAALRHLGLEEKTIEKPPHRVAVIVIGRDPQALLHAYRLQHSLTEAGLPATVVYASKKVLKKLGKLVEEGYTHAAIIGLKEAKEGTVTLRDLRERRQTKYSSVEEAVAALSAAETKPT